jgi:hypothetical protein
LKDHAAIGAGAGDFLFVEDDGAGGGHFQAGEDADERGFTAAGWTYDADKFAAMDLEVDVVECLGLALAGGEYLAKLTNVEDDRALVDATKSIDNRRLLV